jgi:hypothetical protein
MYDVLPRQAEFGEFGNLLVAWMGQAYASLQLQSRTRVAKCALYEGER